MSQTDLESQKNRFITIFSDISHRMAHYSHPALAPCQHPFNVADNYLWRQLGHRIAREKSDPALLRVNRRDILAKPQVIDWIKSSDNEGFCFVLDISLRHTKQWLEEYKCESHFTIQHQCQPLDQNQVDELISDLDQYLDKGYSSSERNPFRYMADLEWRDITITFVNEESIRVSAKNERRNYNYTEMNFADKRKGDRPDSLWGLMRGMARIGGRIPTNAPGLLDMKNRGKTEKQIQTIRKRLKEFFNITTNPIKVNKGRSVEFKYEIQFVLQDSRPLQGKYSSPELQIEHQESYLDTETGEYISD